MSTSKYAEYIGEPRIGPAAKLWDELHFENEFENTFFYKSFLFYTSNQKIMRK